MRFLLLQHFFFSSVIDHCSQRHRKTWKNGKAYCRKGILSRLEKLGNFTQNTGKIGNNYTGKLKTILERSAKFVSQVEARKKHK